MSASRVALAFVFVLSLGACHRDRCLSACERQQKELRCKPRQSCKATCDELREPSPCLAAMRGWENCIVSLPTDGWECNQASQLVPKETACQEARGQVVS